jgi:hypothetical protein
MEYSRKMFPRLEFMVRKHFLKSYRLRADAASMTQPPPRQCRVSPRRSASVRVSPRHFYRTQRRCDRSASPQLQPQLSLVANVPSAPVLCRSMLLSLALLSMAPPVALPWAHTQDYSISGRGPPMSHTRCLMLSFDVEPQVHARTA